MTDDTTVAAEVEQPESASDKDAAKDTDKDTAKDTEKTAADTAVPEKSDKPAKPEKPAKPARRRRLLGNRRPAAAATPEKPASTAEASNAATAAAATDSDADEVEDSVEDSGADGAAASEKPVDTETADDGDTEAKAESAAESEGAAETDEESEAASGADTDTEAAETPSKRAPRKRLSRKRLAAVAALVASLLFVGSAAFAGATVQPYLTDRANVAIKLKVARTAANAITTLWTYTPENMDTLADRAANYLSGDFGAQYRKFVDSIVAPNKQAKITNSTEVTGVAVESLDGDNAVAIVYTNTTTTSPLTKNIPAMKYLSYRLILRRENDRWLVTRMTTVTSLDLTPRL